MSSTRPLNVAFIRTAGWANKLCATEASSDPDGAPRDCPIIECATTCEDVGYECGQHPDCPFLDCGDCAGGDYCNMGTCEPSPCGDVTEEGCCGEGGVIWCENNQLNFLDCGEDGCGWYADAGFYACGATDTPVCPTWCE